PLCPDLSGSSVYCFIYRYAHPRRLHSFPTRRSSDLCPDRLLVRQVGAEVPRFNSLAAQIIGRLGGFDSGAVVMHGDVVAALGKRDRKSTRLNSSHVAISYAVLCLKKKQQPARKLADL